MQCLRRRYVSFLASVTPNVVHFYSHPDLDFNALVTGRSRIPFMQLKPSHPFCARTDGLLVPLQTGREQRGCRFSSSFYPFMGWLTSGMSASILISRFRSRFVKLCKANSVSLVPASHTRTAASFRMRNLSGFYGSALCKNIPHQLFVILQAGLFCNQFTPDGSKLSTK